MYIEKKIMRIGCFLHGTVFEREHAQACDSGRINKEDKTNRSRREITITPRDILQH